MSKELQSEMLDLKLKGYCCSQIIMEMGLRRLDKENPDLIAAMAGLCDGMYCDKTCGILSSAICLLYLADPQEASMSAVSELTEWFEDAFGATDCIDLLGDNPLQNKVEKCPMIIEATFQMIEDLLDWE